MKAVEENIKNEKKKGIFNLSSSFFYSSVLVFYFILFLYKFTVYINNCYFVVTFVTVDMQNSKEV